MTVALKTAPPVFPRMDLERLREQKPQGIEAKRARLRKATKEFEAFFMHYMLKNMRATVPKDTFAGEAALSRSLGKEIFTDLFDMEIARRITRGGDRSIAGMLYKSLEKLIEAPSPPPDPDQPVKPVTQPESRGIELKHGVPALPTGQDRFIRRPQAAASLPLSGIAPREEADPILAKYGPYIDQAASESKLDSALIASVIRVESGGDPKAVSTSGAKGLMQLADATARQMDVKDPFDPEANIMAGSKYLSQLLDRYGDLKLALAAYNAGPGNVDRYGGVPPFRETRAYIVRVSNCFKEAAARFAQPGAKGRRDASR